MAASEPAEAARLARQETLVLAALEAGQAITPQDALERFDCFRLAARIYRLRKAGHDIVTKYITEGDKTFARYHLAARRPKPKQGELFGS
jgi:hypothetical protein